MADQPIDFAVFAAVSQCDGAIVEQACGIAVFAGILAGIFAAGSVIVLAHLELRNWYRQAMLW
ncbi:MAG TPA: hypothetical protein VF510_16345 [Ktedonobacterales bacterium]